MRLGRVAVIGRALAAQARKSAPPRVAPLELAPCAAALTAAGARVVVVRVDARRKPWTSAGVTAESGAPLTWLAHGDSWALGRRGPHFDAAMTLRVRCGGSPPSQSGTGPTHTVTAPAGGPVEICCLWPGEFQGPDERVVHDPIMPRLACGGGFDVVVAAWSGGTDVESAMARAAAADPTGLCRAEAARLADPVVPPDGWTIHPATQPRGVHRTEPEGIVADTAAHAEIVRHEARMQLTPGLRLRWRWRMDSLPSALAEDTLLTHDYLSIAVEFNDGTDLTYYWSASLPPGTAYRCPLPHWRRREWHQVVRSGSDGLGTWQDEERPVAMDRASVIGGATPREVVAVWLIATAVAQRRRGLGSYAEVCLADGDRTLKVL